MRALRLFIITVSLIIASCSELPEGACRRCLGKGYLLCEGCGGTGYCHICEYGWTECHFCDGKGVIWDISGYQSCPHCNRIGTVKCWWCGGDFRDKCTFCHGSSTRRECPDCDGTGLDPDWLGI